MVVSNEVIDVDDDLMAAPDILLASRHAMGNGSDRSIRDIVYVRPATFESAAAREIASEIDGINRGLVEAVADWVVALLAG